MAQNLTDVLRRELNDIHKRMEQLTRRQQAIQHLLKTYSAAGNRRGGTLVSMPMAVENQLSTLDMAERMIEKHGEMKAEEIMEAIRQEFGVKPAHTLPQMLYIRARAKKRFYRSPEGKFGIVEKKKSPKRAA
ncbi:MAG TPA: hypothetical protein VN577_17080 [Terriglobales bacterium]|nr:hypothetical protein [Terriglobales bacterium]